MLFFWLLTSGSGPGAGSGLLAVLTRVGRAFMTVPAVAMLTGTSLNRSPRPLTVEHNGWRASRLSVRHGVNGQRSTVNGQRMYIIAPPMQQDDIDRLVDALNDTAASAPARRAPSRARGLAPHARGAGRQRSLPRRGRAAVAPHRRRGPPAARGTARRPGRRGRRAPGALRRITSSTTASATPPTCHCGSMAPPVPRESSPRARAGGRRHPRAADARCPRSRRCASRCRSRCSRGCRAASS